MLNRSLLTPVLAFPATLAHAHGDHSSLAALGAGPVLVLAALALLAWLNRDR